MINVKAFWIFTIAVFFALHVPSLIQDDMFLDGVTYAAISKNLAHGYGTFWMPHYTQTKDAVFHGHPPLVFGIQSLFFRVLGDSLYVERLFTLVMTLLSGVGIALCWHLLFEKTSYRSYSWLPVLLWMITPLVLWSNKNNILENVVHLFAIFSVYFVSKSLLKGSLLSAFLGGVFIFLALLSKGPVGLFPLVVPFIFLFVFKCFEQSKAQLHSAIIIFVSITLFSFLIFILPEAKSNFESYFAAQLYPSISGLSGGSESSRFSILVELFIELIVPATPLFLIILNSILDKERVNFINNKTALYFLMIALSASLPILISSKLRKYYLTPSISFYVLAISALIVPHLDILFTAITDRMKVWLVRFSYLTLFSVLLFSVFRFGSFKTEKPLIADSYKLSQIIPAKSIISATNDVNEDWRLIAYLSRIGYLSLENKIGNDYFLARKSEEINANLLIDYTEMTLDLNGYKIFRKTRYK
jgi:4-amino-4-deoxy-L-arabinose transferase-like glycosyltransferase